MLSNKRYQVFVSSTQADLRDEREAIINSLTKIGYIAVGMEQFPATDEEQMDYIRPVIDESDYYIVVIKGKYGSIGADGVSYTEKEFRYAVETKKPALAFLYAELKALRVAETDDDPDKLRKLKAFRSELEQKRIVNYWLTSDELVSRVKDSLNDLVRRRPAVGWIRGDQALDPDVYRERDELRKQVDNLNQRLTDLHVDASNFLAHGDDELDIHYSIEVHRYSEDDKYRYIKTDSLIDSVIFKSCDEIIVAIRDELYIHPAEIEIKNSIAKFIAKEIEIDRATHRDTLGIMTQDRPYIILSDEMTKRLRHHFEALGLITGVMINYTNADDEPANGLCWRLTDKGRIYIANMYAFKKGAKA
jgi:Domain of unknown function (DUF4062)